MDLKTATIATQNLVTSDKDHPNLLYINPLIQSIFNIHCYHKNSDKCKYWIDSFTERFPNHHWIKDGKIELIPGILGTILTHEPLSFDEFVCQSVCYGTNMWCGIDFEPLENCENTCKNTVFTNTVFTQKRKLDKRRGQEKACKYPRHISTTVNEMSDNLQ